MTEKDDWNHDDRWRLKDCRLIVAYGANWHKRRYTNRDQRHRSWRHSVFSVDPLKVFKILNIAVVIAFTRQYYGRLSLLKAEFAIFRKKHVNKAAC